ncbi:hypothetical protein CHS0354_032935 [Potamilus streckersoni]|uniref:DUF4706 domain-containing protein n=1 Tax=Potamilus streckersoni TaxID=2493646 RepID=A0AAE0VJS7_9BIVA|nr:hypothetical protein CHS0354_032935 [Potamilus streckersoni]
MEKVALSYFSSINPLARKILKDESDLIETIGEEWDKFTFVEKESILDDFFVDVIVRQKYAVVEKKDSYPLSFPRLKIESGEKIIVNFESDCWTWQDEHSAPFSWKSKSQEKLNLLDLEPEQFGKPTSDNTQRKDKAESKQNLAPREFSVTETPRSIWESPFLKGIQRPEYLSKLSAQQTTTQPVHIAEDSSPEAVNYAFTGSEENLSRAISSEEIYSKSSSAKLNFTTSNDSDIKPPPQTKFHSKTSKSPSKSVTTKMSNSSSFSKNGLSDDGVISLVREKNGEEHAFDNPMLNDDWSTFINEASEGSSTSTVSPSKQRLLKEPEEISMDRGTDTDKHKLNIWRSDGLESGFESAILLVDDKPSETVVDIPKSSTLTKTGLDFLDNW